MASLGTGNGDFQAFVAFAKGLPLKVEAGCGIYTSGAAHKELSLILGVQVDQGLAVEETFLQGEGSVHSGFLGDGEKAFQFAAGFLGVK